MTADDPTPLDLSDDALFAGMAPAPAPTADPEALVAAVSTAFRVMRAANLKVTFGMDMDDAERLWPAKMAGLSPVAIVQAANAWIESGSPEFPILSEFETLARSQQAAIDRPPHPEREPGNACPECGDTDEDPTDGWVAVSNPLDGGTGTVRPCEECNPERYVAWKRHFPRKVKKRAAA